MTLSIPSSFDNVIGSIIAHLVNLAERAGNLVRTLSQPYHLASGCGGGPPAPCTCGWPGGLAATYTVSGWASLAPCPSCDTTSFPEWTGALNHIGGGCVWWAADSNFDPTNINGAMLDITYTQVLLRTTVTPCRWELYIACTSTTHPTRTLWYGYKTTGATPAGTYTFVGSDCGNTTPTMTIA